jgi:hypothetical protein
MVERLWRYSFAGCMVVVSVLMLLPSGGGPMLPGQDKLLHGLIFMALYLIGVRGFSLPGQHKWLFGGLLGYGILIELMQGLTGYRSMELLDALADFIGLVVGQLWSRRKPSAGCCH